MNGIKKINVSSSIKQGCILSPVLFNLFLNDLIIELNISGCGVNVGDEQICVLGYVDDIVCLTETTEELQTMLNIIHSWCQLWAMLVNTKKTQIVHFRSCSTPKTDHTFTFGGETINVSHKYK